MKGIDEGAAEDERVDPADRPPHRVDPRRRRDVVVHSYADDPPTTPTGAYLVLACADDLKVVAETSETNNFHASAAALTVTP